MAGSALERFDSTTEEALLRPLTARDSIVGLPSGEEQQFASVEVEITPTASSTRILESKIDTNPMQGYPWHLDHARRGEHDFAGWYDVDGDMDSSDDHTDGALPYSIDGRLTIHHTKEEDLLNLA